MIETEVLIVGSGPAGSTSALALSTYGVPNVLVTKYRWLANTPRAHITNQRTFEVLRDLGVEAEAKALAVPQDWMGNTVFCTSLAGEELGRIHTWGTHPSRRADYRLASPCEMGDLPQTLLEPILLGNAASRGTRVRFDTEYLSLVQDADGVTATVRDRLDADREYEIRAKYLIGADGGRSKVAEDVGLPMEGEMGRGGSMNIVFEADLSRYVAHRPSVLYWVVQPGSDIGGIGMGLVRMVRPWNEWLIVWGYDINGPAPDLTDAEAVQIVRNLVGDQEIPVRIKSTSLWTVNNQYATRYSNGRVFCMGDAVHRHPPSNGLGSNTSIQDAYNLAWKLALVTQGKADPGLLHSYDAERTPIGRQIVTRANKSIEEFGPIFEALGLLGTRDAAQMRANIAARKAASAQAAEQREKLRRAIAFKTYEFNAHGVEMNQRYKSSAVIPDGTPEPQWARDHELYYEATTRPGARLPHCWLQRAGLPVSTLDIAGQGRFTLLTGIGGEAWVDAARAVAGQFDVPIVAHVIGPGLELEDLFGEWAEGREVSEAGCVVVRPDSYVAWRAESAASGAVEAEELLLGVFARLLGKARQTPPEPSDSPGGATRRGVLGGLGLAAVGAALLRTMVPTVARAARGGTVRIGYVSPQTGALAPFAAADDFVLGAAREAFRAFRQPVEILVRDSQSNPNRAATVAGDLINAGVSLMLVASTPETTNPVSDQCELAEVPCLSTVAPWQPWFFTRGGKPAEGFQWTYHFFWGLEDVIEVYTAMWAQLDTDKAVGGLFPNDGDGNAWGDKTLGFPPMLDKLGFTLRDPGRFQSGTDNFSAQIAAFKAARVDIVTGVVIPPDWTTFWTQARQQGFRPKIASVGKALLFPTSVEALGAAGQNLSTEVWWSPRHPYRSSLTGETCAKLAEAYTARTGRQWTQPIGFTHALFELAADILKRAEDPTDRPGVLDALTRTNLDTVVGPIAWGKGPVKNVAKTPLVGGQWRTTPQGPSKYDLVITSNTIAPAVPVADRMQPVAS